MLLLWGVVEEPNTPEECSGSWDTCMSQCYDEASCVLLQESSSGNRQIFRVGKVLMVTKTDISTGNKIGLKTILTTCTSTLTGNNTVTLSSSTNTLTYQFTISQSDVSGLIQFNFNYSTFIQCPSDSYISYRAIPVCISIRLFPNSPYCDNQVAGLAMCLTDGGVGLTGPYSTAEGSTMTTNINALVAANPSTPKYSLYDFWIDGTRPPGTGPISVSDTTLNGTIGYKWDEESLKKPTWGCVFFYNGLSFSYDCSATIVSGMWCMRGVICRTEPIYLY